MRANNLGRHIESVYSIYAPSACWWDTCITSVYWKQWIRIATGCRISTYPWNQQGIVLDNSLTFALVTKKAQFMKIFWSNNSSYSKEVLLFRKFERQKRRGVDSEWSFDFLLSTIKHVGNTNMSLTKFSALIAKKIMNLVSCQYRYHGLLYFLFWRIRNSRVLTVPLNVIHKLL